MATTSLSSPDVAPLSPVQTSLLAAMHTKNHVHLILGTNPLAATRCGQSLAAGATPIIIAPDSTEPHYTLQNKIDTAEVKWLRKEFQDDDLFKLGRDEVHGVVDAVFITSKPKDPETARISALCRRHRVPVNVIDAPTLCTFTLLSTYTDGPLQIGVTTNGRGCKLASRIRREIVSSLPPSLGTACARLGEVRRRIQLEDSLAHAALEANFEEEAGTGVGGIAYDADDTVDQSSAFNRLVLEEDLSAAKSRRIRWLSQVCEYWPLRRLSEISDAEVDAVLRSYHVDSVPISMISPTTRLATVSHLSRGTIAATTGGRERTESVSTKGRIILAGSGPGHPDLLTRATHKAILSADVILADKLVPAGVLNLIPRRTPVHIARKFPGNADAAQDELLSLALAAMKEGKTVLRLKQGDPYLYGRGGEEYAYFAAHGASVDNDRMAVVPGVTSALSAPLFAAIPATQRDISDQVLICTGTGKKGKPPVPPEFVPSRTVVFLMALHRIEGLARELTQHLPSELETKELTRTLYPLTTPCAVIERASCPDQRVIRTTLKHVQEAIEAEGSRPPGLLVVGRACEALVTIERGRAWAVEDGFRGLDLGLEEFAGSASSVILTKEPAA